MTRISFKSLLKQKEKENENEEHLNAIIFPLNGQIIYYNSKSLILK
jgi:hypothetical protein